MDLFILVCIAAINIMMIFGLYRCLRGIDNKRKLGFIAIGVGSMYLLVSFIYYLSTLGLQGAGQAEVLATAKQFVTFTFVPVNSTIILIFLARSYVKVLNREIKKEKFKRNCIILFFILLIALSLEYFYFQDFNVSMLNMIK